MAKKTKIKRTAPNKTIKRKKRDAKGQRITRDMLIGEVITAHPSLIPVLLREGIHCVGCGAAYAETVEQGLASHGKSDTEIDAIIKRLNDSIPQTFGNATLKVTGPAIAKLKQFLKDGAGLRIEVTPGGCAGFSYTFDIEKTKKKDDTLRRQFHRTRALAFPDGAPQERSFGVVFAVNRYGLGLGERLLDVLPVATDQHYLLTL